MEILNFIIPFGFSFYVENKNLNEKIEKSKKSDLNEKEKNDKISSHLGKNVYMFVWHNDEVYPDHPDLNIIAYTEDCPNHIFRYKDKCIWSINGL